MANNELAIRFTEGKYATKSEVGKELKMSLIDNIWSNILSYRSNFYRYLTIRSIEKNQLILCLCPSIASNSSQVDMKLIRLMKEHASLMANSSDVRHFEDECFASALRFVANEHELDVTDQFLRSIIRNDVKEVSHSHAGLVHYLNALHYVQKCYVNPINEDFLAELYSRVSGQSELTSFYRDTEDKNPENRVLIDRVYTCAPVQLIESMMNNLFDFIANANLSGASKAAIAYYYINYIRPFPLYSDEIALLMAKAILAHFDLGEIGALMPLESLLVNDQQNIARLFVEVQKTADTTYFVNYFMKFVDEKCNELLDLSANVKAAILRKDFYQEETPAIVAPKIEEEPVVEEIVKDEPAVEQEIKEEPKPVEPKPIAKEEEKEDKIEQVALPKEMVSEAIAVNYIPPALDEKQACRLEQHLLELDPSLRRHEAHFYARHCTLGKRYTIAQYKKSIGCVYETARTAMDHLVELQYYRKEMVKNKNVYTPVVRK